MLENSEADAVEEEKFDCDYVDHNDYCDPISDWVYVNDVDGQVGTGKGTTAQVGFVCILLMVRVNWYNSAASEMDSMTVLDGDMSLAGLA